MNDSEKIREILSTKEAILAAIPPRIGMSPRVRELVVEDILSAFPNLSLEPVANPNRPDLVEVAKSALPGSSGLPVAISRQEVAETVVVAILKAFPKLILEPPANLYRVDRPRSRKDDPATSAAAAEKILPLVRRPGGKVHRILRAYVDVATIGVSAGSYRFGATAREIEFVANVKAAHKRTSELLADGLLRVVTNDLGEDMVRKGGRILAITEDGRAELARMDRALKERETKRLAREQRRRVREASRT